MLHKLIEEILTGELEETTDVAETRAAMLLRQLGLPDEGAPPDPAKMAATALRVLDLPGIAEYRSALMPEVALYGARNDDAVLIAGRADAIALAGGRAAVVFDWKSDVAPTLADRQAYAGQLLTYMEAVGAPRGAVVYLTLGQLDWIDGVDYR